MLREFNLVRVLKRTDTELALLGNFKSDRHKKAAVLIIQTTTMYTQILNQLIVKMTLHKTLMNDIYNTFLAITLLSRYPWYSIRVLQNEWSEKRNKFSGTFPSMYFISALATVAAESARLDTDEVSCSFAAAIVQSYVDSALDIVPHEARKTHTSQHVKQARNI
ncbi:hypothetical protein PsorP6_016783 [Peronosclerospora sorghi]|uniref:Uncharacterized protein n=1 Tax=Peronosclerospora sorghi TaxID=230839 RepID=A0ACC0WE42_9STRA|nr:hypothetical protein PsorP6_016783 [Peronosclerospora sorghi]